MHSARWHKDHLFIAHENLVIVYRLKGLDRVHATEFTFEYPVLALVKSFDDLTVSTKKADYVICGGPATAEFYVCILRYR